MRIGDVNKPPTWVRMAKLDGVKKIDPIAKFDTGVNNASKPALEEPAMTHPFNTSTVKIRNNGIIDVFAQGDQGIRVDPNTRTINLITDGLKEHLNYFKGFIMEDAQWWAKKSIYFKSEQSYFKVDAYDGIFLNSGRDFEINCKGNLKLTAKGTVTITGSKLYLNE